LSEPFDLCKLLIKSLIVTNQSITQDSMKTSHPSLVFIFLCLVSGSCLSQVSYSINGYNISVFRENFHVDQAEYHHDLDFPKRWLVIARLQIAFGFIAGDIDMSEFMNNSQQQMQSTVLGTPLPFSYLGMNLYWPIILGLLMIFTIQSNPSELDSPISNMYN